MCDVPDAGNVCILLNQSHEVVFFTAVVAMGYHPLL